MKKLIFLFLALTLIPVHAAAQGTASKVRSAGSLPSTCVAGTARVAADIISVGGVLYLCAATDTWVASGGGGGGAVSSLTGTPNQISVSTPTGAITISIPTNPTLPGLVKASTAFLTPTANPADFGFIRLAATDGIDWRNRANSGNVAIGISAASGNMVDNALLHSEGFYGAFYGSTSTLQATTGLLRGANNVALIAGRNATNGANMTLTPDSSNLWTFSHGARAPGMPYYAGTFAGTKCLETSGTAGLIVETAAACGSGSGLTGMTATRFQFALNATTLADDAQLTWDNTLKSMYVGAAGAVFPDPGAVISRSNAAAAHAMEVFGVKALNTDTGASALVGISANTVSSALASNTYGMYSYTLHSGAGASSNQTIGIVGDAQGAGGVATTQAVMAGVGGNWNTGHLNDNFLVGTDFYAYGGDTTPGTHPNLGVAAAYYAGHQKGWSPTINALFYGEDQGTAANDYAVYLVGGKVHKGDALPSTCARWNATKDLESATGGECIVQGSSLPAFSGAPTVTPNVTGSTTRGYFVIAKLGIASHTTSASTTIMNSVATSALNASNYNDISWSAVAGATSYDVYDDSPDRGAGNFPRYRHYLANVVGTTYRDDGSAFMGSGIWGNFLYEFGGYNQGQRLAAPYGVVAGDSQSLMGEVAGYYDAPIIGSVIANDHNAGVIGNSASFEPTKLPIGGYFSALDSYADTVSNVGGPTGALGSGSFAHESGTIDRVIGLSGSVGSYAKGSGGTVTKMLAGVFGIDNYGQGTVVDLANIHLLTPKTFGESLSSVTRSSGAWIGDMSAMFSPANSYALRIDAQSDTGPTHYAIWNGGGKVHLDDLTASRCLELNATKDIVSAGALCGGSAAISDAAYGVAWNGDTTNAPSKNTVYDKIESVIAGATPARFTAGGGVIVDGDIVLGAGWGSTAAKSAITGHDQAFNFTITAGGTGIAANPTFTMTFRDGAWALSPIFVCWQTGGNDVLSDITFTNGVTTATTIPGIWNGTPTTAKTYIITCIGVGR